MGVDKKHQRSECEYTIECRNCSHQSVGAPQYLQKRILAARTNFEKVNGKDVFVIQLTPTGKQGDFKQIEVAVDQKTNSIVQVKPLLKNNLKNVIDINNYNTNYHFDDSIFVFNSSLHPEAEIVDLR